jgi:hypothetical protein
MVVSQSQATAESCSATLPANNNEGGKLDDAATRAKKAAMTEAKNIIRNGGTQEEAIKAAKVAARRLLEEAKQQNSSQTTTTNVKTDAVDDTATAPIEVIDEPARELSATVAANDDKELKVTSVVVVEDEKEPKVTTSAAVGPIATLEAKKSGGIFSILRNKGRKKKKEKTARSRWGVSPIPTPTEESGRVAPAIEPPEESRDDVHTTTDTLESTTEQNEMSRELTSSIEPNTEKQHLETVVEIDTDVANEDNPLPVIPSNTPNSGAEYDLTSNRESRSFGSSSKDEGSAAESCDRRVYQLRNIPSVYRRRPLSKFVPKQDSFDKGILDSLPLLNNVMQAVDEALFPADSTIEGKKMKEDRHVHTDVVEESDYAKYSCCSEMIFSLADRCGNPDDYDINTLGQDDSWGSGTLGSMSDGESLDYEYKAPSSASKSATTFTDNAATPVFTNKSLNDTNVRRKKERNPIVNKGTHVKSLNVVQELSSNQGQAWNGTDVDDPSKSKSVSWATRSESGVSDDSSKGGRDKGKKNASITTKSPEMKVKAMKTMKARRVDMINTHAKSDTVSNHTRSLSTDTKSSNLTKDIGVSSTLTGTASMEPTPSKIKNLMRSFSSSKRFSPGGSIASLRREAYAERANDNKVIVKDDNKVSIKDEDKTTVLSEESDYNPNWRDSVVDTVLSAPPVNPFILVQQQQQQQQKRLEEEKQQQQRLEEEKQQQHQKQQQHHYHNQQQGQMYQRHPGVSPYPGNSHFPSLNPAIIPNSQALSGQMPQPGNLFTIKSPSQNLPGQYHNSAAGNSNILEGGQQQHHHHSRVPVSRGPSYKINANLSLETEDDNNEDRYAARQLVGYGAPHSSVGTTATGFVVGDYYSNAHLTQNGIAGQPGHDGIVANHQMMMAQRPPLPTPRLTEDQIKSLSYNNNALQMQYEGEQRRQTHQQLDPNPIPTIHYTNYNEVISPQESSLDTLMGKVGSPYFDVNNMMYQMQQMQQYQQDQQLMQQYDHNIHQSNTWTPSSGQATFTPEYNQYYDATVHGSARSSMLI